VAEAILLALILLAPWPYGSAGDQERYLLAGFVFGAAALWVGATRAGLPAVALRAAALPALGLVQLAVGISVAPVWTAEAVLVLAAMLAALVFWSERGRDRDAAQRLVMAVLATASAQAVFGAVQWSLAPDRIYGQATPVVTTPFGSFVNHNHFAGLVEMGAVLATGIALGHARRSQGANPRSVAFAGLALGLAAAVLASRSRGGLVALAAGLVLVGALWSGGRAGSRRSVAVAALGVVGVLAFALVAVPNTTRQHLATIATGADLSGEYRIDMARATLRLAAAHPLAGSGLGAYADAVPAFKTSHGDVRSTHAESDALEFLGEAGLAGGALLVWLGAQLLRGFRDRVESGRDPVRHGLAVGALGAAGALLVHSLVDFNLRIPSNALVFASLAGLAGAPRSEGSPPLGGRRAALAAAVVLSLLGCASAWRAAGASALDQALLLSDRQLRIAALDGVVAQHPYLAEAYRGRGDAFWEIRRISPAQQDLVRALRLRPAWGEAWADLAWVRFLASDRAGSIHGMEQAERLDPTHVGIAGSLQALRAALDAR
jgi:O-antigen ligase